MCCLERLERVCFLHRRGRISKSRYDSLGSTSPATHDWVGLCSQGLASAIRRVDSNKHFYRSGRTPLSIFVGVDLWCGGVLGGWTSSPWWLCPIGRYPFGNDRDHYDLAGPHREGVHSRVCFESSPDRRIDLFDLFRARQAFSDEVGLRGLTPIRKNN